MSETPKQLELIEGFYNFADRVATLTNTEIVAALGDDADWQYWAGRDEIPAMFKENCSPEKFKRLSDLWTLRESASGYSCDLSEYDPTEWAKEQYKAAQQVQKTEEHYNHAKKVMSEAANSLRVTQSDYANYKKSSEQEFRCLKAEIITSLRAIDLCLLASLCTRNQWLTHKARNFRMRHVHQIISNEIDRFGDRKLTNYEDDF